MAKITITKEEKEVFDYLNELRESGVTNMYGAGVYIQNQFGYDRQKANKVLSKWMENFDINGYDNCTII